MFSLQQTTSNNVPAGYTKRRTDFIRYTVILLLFLLLPCSSRMESDDSEIPCDNDIVTVETADSSGSRLTAEEVILEGKTGGIKSLCVFSGVEGRTLVNVAGKTGYRYVWTGDGARTDSWKITGETGSLCALMRIGTTHHAADRVTARKSSWATDRPDEEVYLWINAYNATNPAVVPASTTRRVIAHGEMVSFETGIHNATVELWSKDGEFITTAPADENGFVIFDSLHAADGADHYTSETFTYGLYDYHAATAFTSDPAHLLPAAGGTAQEWVNAH